MYTQTFVICLRLTVGFGTRSQRNLCICFPELLITGKASKPSRTSHRLPTITCHPQPLSHLSAVWDGDRPRSSASQGAPQELRESPAFLPCPFPQTGNELTWLGCSQMSRKTPKGLDRCTHSPVLFYSVVPKPSPFIYSHMHRQSDLISSCTALMRGQRKLIKRCSPLGNTSDCNTSTGLHTPTRNKSGAPHKEGLSSSRPAQSAWEEWMLFSA